MHYYDRIPSALTERKQWVVWKTVNRGGKPTKIPFQVNGQEAKSNDPSTWITFDAARDNAENYDGIGYVFAQDDPFIGIDLDGCRDPKTGKVSDWAREIIKTFATYSEISPSQTGVKLWAIGKSPFPTGKKKELDHPKVCDKNPAIEVYDRLRYFAMTGQRLAGLATTPIECQDKVEALCTKFWPPTSFQHGEAANKTKGIDDVMERARAYVAKMPGAISGSGGHNAAFKVACILVMGFGLDQNQARQIFNEYNSRCDPQWSDREIQHKLESAANQSGQRGYLRDAVPEQFDRIRVPKYEWKHEREIRITMLKDAALAYLAKIREHGHKLIEIGLPELDYSLGGGMEFGEMVIIGGRPGHGKSVFGLQAVHASSLAGYPCLIISEEMSALALGKRTIQYASEVPEEYWRHREDVEDHLDQHFAVRAPVLIAEGCSTSERACKTIEKVVRESGVRVVAIDYMQLLKGFGRDRFEQITNTSVMLRQLANEQKILLVALVQLNREIEKRNRFTPVISDIRECGQIEQDADAVVFVVWPHRIKSSNPPSEYNFFIAKNRNRAINQAAFVCKFEPSRQRFSEMVAAKQESTCPF